MKNLVIFDVDNTIVKGQSQALFIKYLYKKKYVSSFYYLTLISWVVLYKFHLVKDPLPPMKYGLSFIKGKTVNEGEKIVNNFFDEVLVKYIYKQALDIIKKYKNEGSDIILVSNAPDILVKKIANYLGVENFLSTKVESENGVYTGNIFGEIMYGEQKLIAVKKYIEVSGHTLENSYAYGDHDSDIHLLKNVAHPYAVNPSGKLKKIAIKNNWPVLNFSL